MFNEPVPHETHNYITHEIHTVIIVITLYRKVKYKYRYAIITLNNKFQTEVN